MSCLIVVFVIDILEYLADLFLRKSFRIQRSGKAFAFILLMAKDRLNPWREIPVAITRYPERQRTVMSITMPGRKPLHLFPDAEFSRRYSCRPERPSYFPTKSPTDPEVHFHVLNICILIRKVVPFVKFISLLFFVFYCPLQTYKKRSHEATANSPPVLANMGIITL